MAMGITNKSAKDAIKAESKQATSLKKLAETFQARHSRKPIAGIDVSVWLCSCIGDTRNQKVVEQYHAMPQVPVTAVSEYVMKRITLFKTNGWEIFFVLDGARNPMKLQTNANRRRGLEESRRRLAPAFQNPGAHTLARVNELRKATMWPREDIYGEIIKVAKQNNVQVIGAPYEADHQLVSLCIQDIIDYVVSTDTDMPFLGIPRVIYQFTASGYGNCKVFDYDHLRSTYFKDVFASDDVTKDDVAAFACFLGNDFLGNIPNQRYSAIINIMKEYKACYSSEERDSYLGKTNHPNPQRFRQA